MRGRQSPVRECFYQALTSEDRLIASLIVFHELRLGCELHHDPTAELERVQTVLSKVEIEPFNEADMIAAASVRAKLRRQSRSIGGFDSLIAGQALARGWTVVTANRREFDRIEGLNVIDWTQEPD